jgi:beta-N-acetylhexosaminidase
MSIEQKVGQLFMVTRPLDMKTALKAVEKYMPGGYVLYATHFSGKKPESLRKTVDDCQAASAIPMLIAVDEEGGSTTRVSRYKAYRESKFPSPQALKKAGGLAAVREDAREKAALLLSLGINVNLAPVADVPVKKGDFIYDRAYSTDPEEAAAFVRPSSRRAARWAGSVLKHFPGYGGNRDTHAGKVVDKRPLETFETSDFLPFQAGFAAGAGAVMVAHNPVSCLDGERPASLSGAVHEALRGLGFDGVVMTDGLAMKAIKKNYSLKEAAVLAVEAGNDMLAVNDYKTAITAVLQAVKSGRIDETRIDQSVRRILRWKEALGLFDPPVAPAPTPTPTQTPRRRPAGGMDRPRAADGEAALIAGRDPALRAGDEVEHAVHVRHVDVGGGYLAHDDGVGDRHAGDDRYAGRAGGDHDAHLRGGLQRDLVPGLVDAGRFEGRHELRGDRSHRHHAHADAGSGAGQDLDAKGRAQRQRHPSFSSDTSCAAPSARSWRLNRSSEGYWP